MNQQVVRGGEVAEESRFSVSADFEKDVQETRAASFVSSSYMQHLRLLPGAGPGPGAWELRGSAQSSRRGRTCASQSSTVLPRVRRESALATLTMEWSGATSPLA